MDGITEITKGLTPRTCQTSLQHSERHWESSETDEVLGLLTKLVVLRGESLTAYSNLKLWITEFQQDGYTVNDIRKMVGIAKKLPKYNPLSYGDLVTAFEEAGETVSGFDEYKKAIAKLNKRIDELMLENCRLGWYKEEWEVISNLKVETENLKSEKQSIKCPYCGVVRAASAEEIENLNFLNKTEEGI